MRSIFYKNYKEFISNKFNIFILFLPLSIYIISDLLNDSFNLKNTFFKIANLLVFYLIVYIPKTFTLEKDNRTFETLITTPLLFRNILVTTLIFYVVCINIPALIYYLVSVIYVLVFPESFNTILHMSIIFIMSIIASINMTLGGLIVSIKAENVIACGMRSPYILIACFLPYTITLSILETGEINSLILYGGYVMINIIIFIISYTKVKTFFDKPKLLSTYTKGV